MKLGLQLKTELKLAPQLIQSLKMLQMPVLKLEQTIRHELAINPLLEEVEELEADTDSDSEVEVSENEPSETEKELAEWEEYLNEDEEGYKVKEQRETMEATRRACSSAPWPWCSTSSRKP